MSVRRALVDCVVLALQDSGVYYPCCKCCFSRIDAEQQDTTRCRCSRCGYSCLREQVDYRYRLSLKVARHRCIFGVTLFGTCLNPFFGIPASGLQRLVDDSDGPVGASTRSTLLAKAVEDCFIGRHFIFGIKVTGTESELWLGRHIAHGSCSKETVQFIASQMILPKAAGLVGCTVFGYYQVLLQKAEEHEVGSTATSKTSRPPATTLLLIPLHSPSSVFSNTTHSASGLLSQSLQRSQHQDCTLTPTPPWQQSLGLVSSSAEQDEGCCTQDSDDENSRQTDYSETPHYALKSCLENPEFTKETKLSPPLSYNSLSFSIYSDSSIEKRVVNTPTLDPWFSPSECVKESLPLSSNTKEFCSTQLTKTFSCSSLAWDDLPFSESLTEFLCEKDRVPEPKPHSNVQDVKETARNNLRNGSQDKKSNTQMTVSRSRLLVDITNTSAPNNGGDEHNLSDSVCKNLSGCVKSRKARSTCLNEYNQHDVGVGSLSFENEGEELEGDTYNCSADLFNSSLVIDMNATLSAHTETVRMSPEVCTLLFNPDKPYIMSEKPKVPHSTPDQQKVKSIAFINKDNLIPPVPQDLDFIPPSQSTPNVKFVVMSGPSASSKFSLTSGEFGSQPDSQDLCAFRGNLPELDRKTTAKLTTSLCTLNPVSTNQLPLCVRESTKENMGWSTTARRRSHRFTPKRRFWKPDEHQRYLLAKQCRRVQKEALNLGSNESVNHKCDSSVHSVTVRDYEDNEVPPTPAPKTRLSAKLRRKQLTDNSSSHFDSVCEGQEKVTCKRTLLHPVLTTLQRQTTQTGSCDSGVVGGGSLDEPNDDPVDDEKQKCDWSRDLFSDSL